jgi:HAD superfamily hydrolase (TIGR01549 family)
MKAVDTLLFDFGGTLDLPGSHWLDRFLGNYRTCGLNLSREDLVSAFTYASAAAYRGGEPIYSMGLAELVDFLVGIQLGFLRSAAPPSFKATFESINDAALYGIQTKICRTFLEQTRPGLNRTREILGPLARRLKLGVVSNFYGNLEVVLKEADTFLFFSAVADSGRLGVTKPDPRIFEFALQRLDSEPARSMMIGDSIVKDCLPAKILGMQTVWLNPSAASTRRPAEADFVISDLSQLGGILG